MANEINLVNIKTNTEVTEDQLSDLRRPSQYYTNCYTNRSSSTTTILIQVRTQYVDTYYNVRDPLRDIQIRFPHWITSRFDEYLGVSTSLLGTIMNVPPQARPPRPTSPCYCRQPSTQRCRLQPHHQANPHRLLAYI